MELTIKKNDFLTLLKSSQGIVEKKGTMPILSNILLEAGSQGLKVSATDLELALIAEVPASVNKNGKSVINGRQLYEIVREAPGDELKVKSHGDFGLEIICGKSQFKVTGMNPQDFPNLPKSTSLEELTLESPILEEMIYKTFYAASSDETRYTLNGLYLIRLQRGDRSFLRFVATDGHRLSYDERELSKSWNLNKGIIIPRKGIAELKNLISGFTGDLQISVDENVIAFRRDKNQLTIRLIEGEFPNYEQVIPKKLDKIVSLSRQEFTGALRRASIMTTEQSRGVKLSFKNNVLEISSSHPDLGEAKEEIPVESQDVVLSAGFNPRYFLELLSVLDDEKIILELKDEVSPCVIRSEFDRGFLSIVMPMRI